MPSAAAMMGVRSSALGWSLVTPVMGSMRIPNGEAVTRVPWGSGNTTRPDAGTGGGTKS